MRKVRARLQAWAERYDEITDVGYEPISLEYRLMHEGRTARMDAASPENFNAEIGRKISQQKAREKIWALEGYLLRQRLHNTG
jgi:hypothetical protein